MKIGFLAMSGLRAHDAKLLKLGLTLPGVIERGNVYGAQIHPEKSSTHGLALLRNITAICARVAA